MSAELKEALIELREGDALRITDELLAGSTDPLVIVSSCKEAMDVIGQRFANGEAFIPELIMAGEIMQAITAKVTPRLAAQAESDKLGSVVVCTVEGDVHDIGKDIVATMLHIGGFEVIDLGVDVPVKTVVDKVREVRPNVLGLSGLLTVAFESMKATVGAIDEAGLRDGLKIMLGGAPVNEDVRVFAGADGWAKDAVGAVDLAKTWIADEAQLSSGATQGHPTTGGA
jgi:methanogenic corrinoid protein MtbC1